MDLAAQTKVRKQIRAFAVAWLGITVLMGACTFVAIYMAYGYVSENSASNIAIPAPTTGAQMALLPTFTPFPTRGAVVVPTQAPPTPIPLEGQGGGAAAAEATEEAQDSEPTEEAEPTIAPTILPVDNRRFNVGIQVQKSPDGKDDIWFDLVSDKLHMNWVKIQVRWENHEVEEGEYNFEEYEWVTLTNAIEAAAERDIKVMLSVVTAPEWAREPGIDTSRHGPPADPEDYANFLEVLLERYEGKVHAIEVWNEMNLDREWTSINGLRAENYVALLRVAYERIKNIDPGIIVISGALSPTGLSDYVRAVDDFAYMDEMIAAGMLNYADCVGAHHNGLNVSPEYTWNTLPNDPSATFRGPWDTPHHSWSFRSTLASYADKIRLAGEDHKLCVTEFGWPSAEGMSGYPDGFEFARDNTLDEQEEWTIIALDWMKEEDIVWLAWLWNLNYGPQAGWDPNNDNVPWSIIGPDWQFRPVFDAMAEWQEENGERLNPEA
jgi:polysaccharide biosynthesis protein PslG